MTIELEQLMSWDFLMTIIEHNDKKYLVIDRKERSNHDQETIDHLKRIHNGTLILSSLTHFIACEEIEDAIFEEIKHIDLKV